MTNNEVTFEVEGVGKFTAYKELPQQKFFLDYRTEVAKLLGGRASFLELEAILRALEKSDDPIDKERIVGIQFEIMRADQYVQAQMAIKTFPEGFTWEGCNSTLFGKIWLAMDGARNPFRKKDEGESKPPDKAAGSDAGGGTTE